MLTTSTISSSSKKPTTLLSRTFPPFIRQWGWINFGEWKFGCSSERVVCLFTKDDVLLFRVQLTPETWIPGHEMMFVYKQRGTSMYLTPLNNLGKYQAVIFLGEPNAIRFTLEDSFMNLENWGYGDDSGPRKWWDVEWDDTGIHDPVDADPRGTWMHPQNGVHENQCDYCKEKRSDDKRILADLPE